MENCQMLMTVLIMRGKKVVYSLISKYLKKKSESGPNEAIPEIEEDIFVRKEVPASRKVNAVRDLKFTNEERNMMLQKHMLSDESINLEQNLLKEQFPKISVFQDTVIGKTQSFNINETNENFIQLSHVEMGKFPQMLQNREPHFPLQFT